MRSKPPVLMLILCIFLPLQFYAQGDIICGNVISVKGKASVKRKNTGSTEILKGGETLFKGDYVLCSQGCEVSIRYCPNERAIPIRRDTRMSVMTCNPITNRRIGGEKGEDEIVVTPYEGEILRPEKFTLKWWSNKLPPRINITVKIESGSEVIFPETTVHSRRGFYRSSGLLDKLRKAQKSGKLTLEVRLSGKGARGKDEVFSVVVFRLLSLEDERKLKTELRELKGADEIFKATERAQTFAKYGVYTEAAKEMERALEFASKQNDDPLWIQRLKEWAIMLDYNAYNETRVRQLCSTISPPYQQPPICVKMRKVE
jgi:hypothetical protein